MKYTTRQQALLLLSDGTIFYGKSIGLSGIAYGEVCFNTGMTGYQEIFTDPSYFGQIVVATYPLIGNYGVNLEDIISNQKLLSNDQIDKRQNTSIFVLCYIYVQLILEVLL